MVVVLNPSEPTPNLQCATCGRKYKYDALMGWGCLVLIDQAEIPHSVISAWCDMKCFREADRLGLNLVI